MNLSSPQRRLWRLSTEVGRRRTIHICQPICLRLSANCGEGTMPMRVLGNRVLVKRIEDKTLTSKIIEVITTQQSEPGVYALVAGVGPGRRLPDGKYVPIEVKEGDVVILKKYSGAPITLRVGNGDSEDFHLVDADDVLAVQVP